jgi:hypothetical protein
MKIITNTSKRTKIIGFSFLLISLAACLYLYLISKPKKPSPIVQVPTQELVLTNSYPPEGNVALTFPSTALSYTFNKTVAISQFNIDISPKTAVTLQISNDNKTLYVKPQTVWKFNTKYEISLIGQQGIVVDKKVIMFTLPQNVPEDTEENPRGI